MTSSKDAFEKFWMWKKSRTLLKVTSRAKGELPESFVGAVVLPEDELLRVNFVDHGARRPRQVTFDGECSFVVGEKVLLVERSREEFFRCEDTGERWEDKFSLDKGNLLN